MKVIFWSQTGNTAAMAKAIGEGIQSAGKETEIIEVSSANPDIVKAETAFALGCPAMGAEVLEESDMEPFVEQVEAFVMGKRIALFGSYGWGDGQWMRDWEERMTKAGAVIVGGEGLICQAEPGAQMLEECRELGKQLAQ